MSGEKQTIVGRFFEEVAHRVLGGELYPEKEIDLRLDKDAIVEVKSSGYRSSYGFRLDLDQIRQYDLRRCWECERAWYFLIAYRNKDIRENGRKTTELARHTETEAIEDYLARSIAWGIIIDIDIVEKWRRTRPISKKSILGHRGTKTVDIRCSELETLIKNGPPKEFNRGRLGEKHFQFFSQTVRRKLSSGRVVRFPLFAILPLCDVSFLEWTLSRRR